MFQSFTGNSRRPRQVNLSGIRSSPSTGAGSSSQQAIKIAQQERANRQQQRLQHTAAKTIQRRWRGFASRKHTRSQARAEFDALNFSNTHLHDRHHVLLLLATFLDENRPDDRERLVRCQQDHNIALIPANEQGRISSIRTLQTLCVKFIGRCANQAQPCSEQLATLTNMLLILTDTDIVYDLRLYYLAISRLWNCPHEIPRMDVCLVQPLKRNPSLAYQAFLEHFLVVPYSPERLSTIKNLLLSAHLPATVLETGLVVLSPRIPANFASLCFLTQILYLQADENDHITLPQHLIPSYVSLLRSLPDVLVPDATPLDCGFDEWLGILLDPTIDIVQPNRFIAHQLNRLVSRYTLRSLIDQDAAELSHTRARQIADYALIVLQLFPSRADEIRIQLCVAPPASSPSTQSTSAVGLFWQECRYTRVFQDLCRSSSAAVTLLVPGQNQTSDDLTIADQWRLVLMFLDLYAFVLRLIDDEEFLGYARLGEQSFRSNPLSIADLEQLSSFLKNLGFALYYQASDISSALRSSQTCSTSSVAGIKGTTLDYVKTLTTSLAKAIYERDSRRHFFRPDQWLMTNKFNPSEFVVEVMSEEDRQRNPDDDDESTDDETDEAYLSTARDSRAQGLSYSRAAVKHRGLAKAMSPRWEILTNMPFLLPFDTRVKIFRECILYDQFVRRRGNVDADTWRNALLFGAGGADDGLERHHAKVRRKHEFKDAFEQLYDLGQDLKEPIQVTFVDEFDIVEAGIDGGGVTKEFLTNATADAFDTSHSTLFLGNSKHLLYPNPTSIDMCRDRNPNPAAVAHLLDQYEFLGRLIGKCLYEGILVDISFAPFFLMQWADQPGSDTHRPRPSLNELRDYDEELYQGLYYLKNHIDSAEELGLTFTVAHEMTRANGTTKILERSILPNGDAMSVTKDNAIQYISCMAQYRLHYESATQSDRFLKGLRSIIEPRWLSMFNQFELQTLIGGASSSIDVADLRKNTVYGGVYTIGDDGLEHASIRKFWSVMQSLPESDKRKVLKFVTSTPRAPLLGFASLSPRFSIRDSGDDQERFPTTSTCVNLLKLPRYQTEDVLRRKLLYAVNANAGFDLS